MVSERRHRCNYGTAMHIQSVSRKSNYTQDGKYTYEDEEYIYRKNYNNNKKNKNNKNIPILFQIESDFSTFLVSFSYFFQLISLQKMENPNVCIPASTFPHNNRNFDCD